MSARERAFYTERERERERESARQERERELSAKKIRGFICLPLQHYSVFIPSTVALYKILSNLR
jgi:hypothetical protein